MENRCVCGEQEFVSKRMTHQAKDSSRWANLAFRFRSMLNMLNTNSRLVRRIPVVRDSLAKGHPAICERRTQVPFWKPACQCQYNPLRESMSIVNVRLNRKVGFACQRIDPQGPFSPPFSPRGGRSIHRR